MKGKLISFEPKVTSDGSQEVFNGNNGPLYKFWVVMEFNGANEKGEASSSKTNPSWTVGKEYTFDRTVNGRDGQFITYRSLKAVDMPQRGGYSGGGGGSFAPKRDYLAFAKQKAIECCYRVVGSLWMWNDNMAVYKDEYYTSPIPVFLNTILSKGNESDIWLMIAAYDALIEKVKTVGIVPSTDPNEKPAITWVKEAEKLFNEIKKYVDDSNKPVNN